VEKSEEEAVRWWRQVADQGNAVAQFKVGCAYDKGKGLEKSEEKAVRWGQTTI